MSIEVQGEVGKSQYLFVVVLALGAAKQSINASEKLFDREWLGQVLDGAMFEAGDPVGYLVPSGEHENGHRRDRADALAHGEAIQVGQGHVKHDEIRMLLGKKFEGCLAVLCGYELVPLEGER